MLNVNVIVIILFKLIIIIYHWLRIITITRLSGYVIEKFYTKSMLISLSFRTKQVVKVMRAKDKGGKKIGSNKYK